MVALGNVSQVDGTGFNFKQTCNRLSYDQTLKRTWSSLSLIFQGVNIICNALEMSRDLVDVLKASDPLS